MTKKTLIGLLAPLATGRYSFQLPAALLQVVCLLIDYHGHNLRGVAKAKVTEEEVAASKPRLLEVLRALATEEGQAAYKLALPAAVVQAIVHFLEHHAPDTETPPA